MFWEEKLCCLKKNGKCLSFHMNDVRSWSWLTHICFFQSLFWAYWIKCFEKVDVAVKEKINKKGTKNFLVVGRNSIGLLLKSAKNLFLYIEGNPLFLWKSKSELFHIFHDIFLLSLIWKSWNRRRKNFAKENWVSCSHFFTESNSQYN